MVVPFHIAASVMTAEVTMRGEPNSTVCQSASNPSAATVELTGSVLPLKLGLGHDERNFAENSLPANCTENEPVPRKVTPDLNATRTLSVAGGVTGAFASTIAAPRQACSWRTASRHGIHSRSAPSIVMLS